MKEAVIVDCVRTPIGRAHKDLGCYRDVRSDDLAVACIQALLHRCQIPRDAIEDVILGCTQQTKEQGLNAGRLIAVMAGLSTDTAGVTVNRLCGSSLQALNQAAHSIMAGFEDVQIVGGLEHMHHIPMDHGIDLNSRLFRTTSKGAMMMGVTAGFLAQTQNISREAQDEFSLRSHQLAAESHKSGAFAREIVPIFGRDEEGRRAEISVDQCVRFDATLDGLSALSPAFMPKFGTVTAGNSSPLNDGASAMLIMSAEKANELGLKPIARIRSTAVAGVEACVMGTGPVPATTKALKRAHLKIDDIDLIELNEAFAAQALACVKMLKIDVEKVNVRGGSIAIGHPLGASGARIATTLLHAMRDRDVQFGLATMCIGAGQGIATVFERLD